MTPTSATELAADRRAKRSLLRLGFAGLGWIGRHRMRALLDSSLIHAAAFYDPCDNACAEALTLAPAAQRATTFEQLLENDLDAVVIATPNALHAEQSIAALDRERAAELEQFLLRPVRDLRLSATTYGVRYPARALRALRRAGIRYEGYLPNFHVPRVFAHHRLTLHVPRRPYVRALPGIPTIRPFEALACGIPLLSSPWEDRESLFNPGDYQTAATGRETTRLIKRTLQHPAEAAAQARRALRTIHARHTCAHRAAQLLEICSDLFDSTPARRTSRLLVSAR